MAEQYAFGNLNVHADTIYKFGVWTVADAAMIYNMPFSYGILLCIKSGGSYPYMQIALSRSIGQIFIRSCNVDLQWSSWYQVK